MNNVPVLRIELEGLRQNVAHIFNQNNKELSEYVTKQLEERLNSEWVQAEISQAVNECIKKAIAGVADDWRLQQAITKMIGQSIEQLIDPKSE